MEQVISRRSPDGSWSQALPNWDSPSTLVLVFGPAYLIDDSAPIAEISELYPNSIVGGCSGAGALIDDEISDTELIVAVARFEKVRISIAFDTVSDANKQSEVGKALIEKLLAQDSQVSGLLLFAGGAITDGDALGAGIGLIKTAQDTKVGGGLAGTVPDEKGAFGLTWVLDNNRRPVNGVVSMIGFSGDSLVFRNAAKGGWKPLGPERVVTSVDQYTVKEIDGRPALDLYKEYLGDKADELPAIALLFPLSSRPVSGGNDDWAPAGVIDVDEVDRSLLLTRKIAEGSPMQLLRGYSGDLFEAAEDAAYDLNAVDELNQLAVVTSCLGRRVTLGGRTADELSYVRQALADDISMIGFYGMGEFSSTPSTTCQLFNYTMTLALIGEQV